MSAAHAAEHPWLGSLSKVPPRRRAARAEVAAVTAQRSAESAGRFAALAQLHPVQEQCNLEIKGSSLGDTNARLDAAEAASAVAMAVTSLSEIATLAAVISAEVNAARDEAQRWEKAAVEAEKEATIAGNDKGTAPGACDSVSGGSAGAGATGAVLAAVKKAELTVCRAEALAREVEAGEAAAVASFEAWEAAISRMAALAGNEEACEPAAWAGSGVTSKTVPCVPATNSDGAVAAPPDAALLRD